jgi:rubrerythrin
MGINYSKKKIIPQNLVRENNRLKYKCEGLEKLIEKLQEQNEYECCVCYSKNFQNKKNIRCNHPLCKGCYNLIPDKRCPICRKKMKVKYNIKIF